MAHGAMLLLSGLVMVAWRPCRSREGRAPRVAIALLLLSAATIWLGSFSLAVALAAGDAAGGLEACGVVWASGGGVVGGGGFVEVEGVTVTSGLVHHVGGVLDESGAVCFVGG